MGTNARMILGAACLGTTGAVCGAEFYPISSVTSSTAATDLYPAERLAQGPGLGFDVNEPHTGAGAAASFLWVTTDCNYPCDYYQEGLPTPVLIFDLGEDRALSEVSNWSFYNDNSGKDFKLRFATDADGLGNFGTSVSFAPQFTAATIDVSLRQSFAFGRTVSARYVEMTVVDNHFRGDGIGGGDRVGLGEVAFAIADAVEEQLLVTAPQEFQALVGETQLSGLGAIPFSFNGSPIAENYWAAALDRNTGNVYFSVPTEGRIYRGNVNDDSATLELFVDRPGAVFHGMAVDVNNGVLLVLDSAGDRIRRYLMSNGGFAGTIGSGATLQRPNELLFDGSRQWLIVSDSGVDKIQIFSSGLGNLLYELEHVSTQGVWGLALDPETGDLIYGSHDRGEVWRWDPLATGATPTLMHSGLSGPRALAYDRQGRLFCVQSGSGQVTTLGETPELSYSVVAGGRDLVLYADCDLNGNYLPDDWESSQNDPFLLRNSNFAGNVDGDSFSNGLEAALGESGLEVTNGAGFDFVWNGEGQFTVEHLALKKSDYRYQLLLSNDLRNWRSAATLPQVISGASAYDTWTFEVDVIAEGFPTAEKIFARVGVELEQ